MTHLSDEFLLAYLDGQLEQGQTVAVSKIAGSNPEISRRVERLRRTQAQLMETLGGFAREEITVPANFLQLDSTEAKPKAQAPAPPLQAALDRRRREAARALRKAVFLGVVFAGGLLGGYGGSLLTAQRAAPLPPKTADRPPAAVSPGSWPADIAQFHSFFPREMLTPHPDAIANPEFIRYQLSRITAKALTLPDFSHYGFALYRGQTLKYRQDNMMQLTYSSKTEPPLTLYVLPADGYSDSGAATQAFGSYKAVSWVSDRVRFLLTAEKSEEDLKVLAHLAQSQMPKKQ
jgi:anti-sigma factor RsiW